MSKILGFSVKRFIRKDWRKMGSQTNAGILQHRKDRNRELTTMLEVSSASGQYWDQAPGSTSQEEVVGALV